MSADLKLSMITVIIRISSNPETTKRNPENSSLEGLGSYNQQASPPHIKNNRKRTYPKF